MGNTTGDIIKGKTLTTDPDEDSDEEVYKAYEHVFDEENLGVQNQTKSFQALINEGISLGFLPPNKTIQVFIVPETHIADLSHSLSTMDPDQLEAEFEKLDTLQTHPQLTPAASQTEIGKKLYNLEKGHEPIGETDDKYL